MKIPFGAVTHPGDCGPLSSRLVNDKSAHRDARSLLQRDRDFGRRMSKPSPCSLAAIDAWSIASYLYGQSQEHLCVPCWTVSTPGSQGLDRHVLVPPRQTIRMTSRHVPRVNYSCIQGRVGWEKNAMALKETEIQIKSDMMV